MSDTEGQKDKDNISYRGLLQRSPSFSYMKAKAERLVTALYMVSRFMPESEPLRMKLRSEGIALLSSAYTPEKLESTTSLLHIVLKIVSLLDVAYRTEYISHMNWNLIRREYTSFAAFLEERGEHLIAQGSMIQENMFDLDMPRTSTPRQKALGPNEHTEETKRQSIKDNKESKGQMTSFVSKTKGAPVSKKKDGRRSAILDLLKKQEHITIRDVARIIPHVSEKTLQRELIALVEEGVLRKEGERRWSTYFLV